MYRSLKEIQATAQRVLNGRNVLPVPIEEIVSSVGIKLHSYDLGEETSGVLVIEKGTATIGYNKNESAPRNRFTIAHELGHYVLHREEDKDHSLFIDKKAKVLFRSSRTGDTESQRMEREANYFAACILMPEDILRDQFHKLEDQFMDEEAIVKALAKKFAVSSVAMSYRVSNLLHF